VQRRIKRGIDVLVSGAFLTVTCPLMAVTALAIYLEDRGPIFYLQERVGLQGRVFRVMKFRSMRVDAERDGIARWAQVRDPRITRVGNFIRGSRIDEIPQIINVLRGEMSFVGPRPERPSIVAELEEHIPYYSYRHMVKPGITGWAQINYPYGASLHDAREKLKFDVYYIKNYSVLLDFVTILQTVRVVLWPQGVR
jgi:exopolysaccharide biosynthesis polyprenyl glycosylphosphotransferase